MAFFTRLLARSGMPTDDAIGGGLGVQSKAIGRAPDEPCGMPSDRSTLVGRALALPVAKESDFFGSRRRPAGVNPDHIKVINDTALRSRLIGAGLAEGLQSPKGPQRIASILRIYPAGDAPGRSAPPSRGEEPTRGAYGLPTVEELNTLLARIAAVERDVSHELQSKITADIDRLKRQIGTLEGDAFERAFRELDRALTARRDLAGQIRSEAFARIDADRAFEPRKYLRLIAREIR